MRYKKGDKVIFEGSVWEVYISKKMTLLGHFEVILHLISKDGIIGKWEHEKKLRPYIEKQETRMNINYSRNYSGYYTSEGKPIYHDDIIIAKVDDKSQAHIVEYSNGNWMWGDYLLRDVVAKGNPRVVGLKQPQLFKSLEGFHQDIKYWSIKKGLHKADPMKQMVKLMEEIGELANGLNKRNDKVIVDSVGDVFVVLTILCQQLNINLTDCVEAAYEEIKDRKGRLVNGIFVKEKDLKKE